MKRLCLIFFSLVTTLLAQAQMVDPVHFSSWLVMQDDTNGEIVFSATIDPGWHVYSTDIADDGPIKATFHVDKIEGAELTGKLMPRGKVIEQYDAMFGTNLRFFENKAVFVQKIRFTKPDYKIEAYLEYGACNDEMCMPPTTVDFKQKGHIPALAKAAEPEPKPQADRQETAAKTEAAESAASRATEPDGLSKEASNGTEASVNQKETEELRNIEEEDDEEDIKSSDDLWVPVTNDYEEEEGKDVSSLWFIFVSGLLAGFLAILTPCVWPIIPMTVSFFIKRNKERKKAIKEAVTYGLSIVVIYVLLGLAITLLFGASALNALSTNSIFNIFFALLLIVFAASFFGAFELTLPSSWANKIDRKSENTTGLLSIFLMAFTLTLVSFSCTGPIIGFLLVAVSTQDNILAPTVGMLGFAIALAIPFTLFALFPSLLKSAPKSGSWMNTVKVVLGFIELAFALKFLSVADLAYHWHLLDREVFIAIWIVLFALLGIYLLGWLKFPHDDDSHKTNVPKFFLGLGSLAFAVYMVPGLWGAPLKAISAFTPPMNTQDFNLYQGSVEARFTDYERGLAAAIEEDKPVMIDFTGYGCVNCRKMEAAVWTDAEVSTILNDKYVLISLYVDDKTELPAPIKVKERGKTVTLRTIGDKWSYLERTLIKANTQPYYVLLDPKAHRLLNKPRSYDEDIDEYIDFLNTGLKNYRDNH